MTTRTLQIRLFVAVIFFWIFIGAAMCCPFLSVPATLTDLFKTLTGLIIGLISATVLSVEKEINGPNQPAGQDPAN